MKRIKWMTACLLVGLIFVGCRSTVPDVFGSPGSTNSVPESLESPESSETESSQEPEIVEEPITITFINEVEKTDVWILTDTKENRKLSLWGTTTLGAMELNEERTISLPGSENGAYVIHMITPDDMYYGVSGIPLEEGYTIRFYKETDPYLVWYVAVMDTAGQEIGTYEVFCAAL